MMNTIATTNKDQEDFERSSRRIENGVEIFERETVSTIRIVDGRFVTKPLSRRSRLIIGSETQQPNSIIVKKRSDLRELDRFLRSVKKPLDAVG